MNASEKAKELFLNAAEQTSAAERQAYLESACAGDVALRREVDEMLEHHAELGSFLQPPASLSATIDEPIRGIPGTVIGPYKLLLQIGEGGMGTVWMAEQTAPVQRKVALKVIKPGMDSRQVIARFEAERQALAMMDHVNIARVFDGGTTENGRPYFVMIYAMSTGRAPFRGESTLAVMKRLCEGTPRPIREVNAEIPEWLTELIRKLHAKDPAQRFDSAAEVAGLLGQHLAHSESCDRVTTAAPIGRGPPRSEHRRERSDRSATRRSLLGTARPGSFPGRRMATRQGRLRKRFRPRTKA